jgi:putative ABC transport system substrate-binding protein
VKRRIWRLTVFLALAPAVVLGAYRVAAQNPAAPPKRVGLLALFGCPIPPDWAGSRRLAELGWIEAQTFVYDCVSTVGRLDQMQALARELVSRHPDVLIATPIPFVKALKQETTTIPIVMITTPEPVRTGIITNLARPEGNVTGVAWWGFDILPKRIELLKELVPHLKRLAIIGGANADPEAVEIVEENATSAARTLDFAWQQFRPVVPNDYDEIFARLAAEHFDAAYITAVPLVNQNRTRIIELALRHLMPAVGEGSIWAKAGLLLSYGQDFNISSVRAAEYVDKILRGATPGELPVEQAIKLELVINLKTAKTLGLTVPPSLLAVADEVIE